jgi:hypothetical protein
MKARGITGKGCYKEYFFIPKWFSKAMTYPGNISLLNVAHCELYVGEGFNKKGKTWYRGSFITYFEASGSYWEKVIKEADFIIHLKPHKRRPYDG